MKTSRLLLAAVAGLFFLAAPAHADDVFGSLLNPSANAASPRPRARSVSPAKGLQLASGLQTSGPLNGSGPGSIAVRLSEDEWRKVFPRKEPAK